MRGGPYFIAGNPAVVIRVDRDEAGDAIGMQASVAAAAEALEATLPEGVRVELIRTRAEEITDRLDILSGTAPSGSRSWSGCSSCSSMRARLSGWRRAFRSR
jgi:hypothetical protein